MRKTKKANIPAVGLSLYKTILRIIKKVIGKPIKKRR